MVGIIPNPMNPAAPAIAGRAIPQPPAPASLCYADSMNTDTHDSLVDWSTPIPFDRMQPGHRYRIVIDDCCAQAEFTATFAGWDPSTHRNGDHRRDLPTARFADGSRLRDVAWLAFPVRQ
jgi:hypothetical protein